MLSLDLWVCQRLGLALASVQSLRTQFQPTAPLITFAGQTGRSLVQRLLVLSVRDHGAVLWIHNPLPLALPESTSKNAFCKSGLFCTSGCLLVKLYCNRSSLGRCMCPQPSHPDHRSSASLSAAPLLCRERNRQRQFHSLSKDCRLLLGRGLVLLSKQKGPRHFLGNVVLSLVLCRIN